jgi:hypothetical protein
MINGYFIKNYKKINYQEFLKTNDYYIQRIKVLEEELGKPKKIDLTNLGMILQEQLIAIALPLLNPREMETFQNPLLG